MKKKLGFLALLAAPLVFAGTSFADTLPYNFVAVATTFNVSGTSQGFNPGSLSTPPLTWLTTPPAADYIYVYTFTNNGPDTVENFTVNSGSAIDAFGANSSLYLTDAFQSGGLVGSYVANFDHLNLLSGHTATLAFAASGSPVAMGGSVQDSSSADAAPFLVSDFGPKGGGTPLPTPAAAWGGLALGGLLAGFRVKKSRTQAL